MHREAPNIGPGPDASSNGGADPRRVWEQIEDLLIPGLKLTAYERAIYYHLVRHSRLQGQRSIQTSMERLGETTGLSDHSARERTRSLHKKGCVRLVERGRTGTTIEVLLPEEIAGLVRPEPRQEFRDIEGIDYFNDAMGRTAIISRDGLSCGYCMRTVATDGVVLDHIKSQAAHGDHSYRNLIVACHTCNSEKAGLDAMDFLRRLLRMDRLSTAEFEERRQFIQATLAGDRKPVFN